MMARTLALAVFILCLCLQQVCSDGGDVKKAVPVDSNPNPTQAKPPENANTSSTTGEKHLTKPTSAYDTVKSSCSNGTANCTESQDDPGFSHNWFTKLQANKDMLLRTMYVLIGITGIVVVYFVIRAWRIRRRKSKSRKYGIITTPGNDMEMEPLDQDDDEDEDVAVFEMNGRRK